jgi:hypothetical protein
VDDQRRCEGQTKGGTRCKARCQPGKAYCFFHDPERAEARAEARSKGGKARSKPAAVLPGETADTPLESVDDVKALLGQTINQLRKGQLDPKVSNGIGYLAGVLLKAIEGSDLARDVEALKQQLRELEEEQRAEPTR